MNLQHRSLLLAALYCSTAVADTELPTLLVSASRTEQSELLIPAGIRIINRQEIEQSAAQNLLQLLNGQSGIQISSLYGDGSQTTLDMRGFGPTAGANTLLLVDGRRLNNSGDRSNPDLNSIDLQRVERIEIIQGSAGTLFGNQAVGGLVNIITREPEAFQGHVSIGAGSYQGTNLYAELSDSLDNGLSYRFSAKHRESDNYREQNETERQDLNLRLDYRHQQGRLFFEQQWVNDEQQNPGSLFLEEYEQDRRQSVAAYEGDFSNTESKISRLGLQQNLGDFWSLEGELTYRDNEREFINSFRAFPGSLATQVREVKAFNPRLIGTLPLYSGEATLTAGFDIERTDYALHTSFGPQLLDQSIDALYVQLIVPVNETTSTTLGYRHARVDNQIDTDSSSESLADQVSVGSLGFTFTPDERLRLFFRVDENYRFATVDEHTNVVYGQPVGLKNQTGLSYETGIEWQLSSLMVKLMIFQLNLENEISYDVSGYSNINLDKTQREGAILEGRWQANKTLSLNASLTYTDPSITGGAFEGNDIPLVARRMAKLGGDWQIASHWSLFSEAVLSGERVVGGDFNNSFERLSGYGLLNAGTHFRSGPWHISLRADNLLDKQYASSASTGYDAFNTQRVAYFPALERNFWLTLNYQI